MTLRRILAGTALCVSLMGLGGVAQATPAANMSALPSLAPMTTNQAEPVRHRRICNRVCTKRIFGKCVRHVTRCYRPRHRRHR